MTMGLPCPFNDFFRVYNKYRKVKRKSIHKMQYIPVNTETDGRPVSFARFHTGSSRAFVIQ